MKYILRKSHKFCNEVIQFLDLKHQVNHCFDKVVYSNL
ncbi:hypothetical protein APA_2110 [Pseudanabaena sp. lw0831]|nr:hypothetical protein APA_2110 [Pseudanabaena sp. lw0831]